MLNSLVALGPALLVPTPLCVYLCTMSSEVKAYTKPPPAVEMVLSAVMILFKEKTDWATAKRKISESNFLFQIKVFDKDNVAATVMQKVSGV